MILAIVFITMLAAGFVILKKVMNRQKVIVLPKQQGAFSFVPAPPASAKPEDILGQMLTRSAPPDARFVLDGKSGQRRRTAKFYVKSGTNELVERK